MEREKECEDRGREEGEMEEEEEDVAVVAVGVVVEEVGTVGGDKDSRLVFEGTFVGEGEEPLRDDSVD